MKRKFTAVLLCLVLLLTLSVNVTAQDVVAQNKTSPNVESNGAVLVEDEEEYTDNEISLAATGAIPGGHLDTVSSTIIGGWAYQSDIPNTALQVHIYIVNNSTGEETLIPVTANGYRPDLEAAGYGNGYHAFQYNINWLTYKPGTYTVYAYAIGVNTSNVQLNNSPKTFTVRDMEGSLDGISSSGISGWAWKPDAPNEEVGIHAHIVQDGTVIQIITAPARNYRADLAAAGYGNGYHGFSISIDWSQFPGVNLRLMVYMYDGSGYSPVLYDGYYNNQPIRLIGMVDSDGRDHSTWATQEVMSLARNISGPRVFKYTGSTKQQLLDYIRNSYFATVYTHGSRYSVEWSEQSGTETVDRGTLQRNDLLSLSYGYFSNTECLLLLACSTASTGGMANNTNLAQTFVDKGVGTVVAFSDVIYSAFLNGTTLLTTQAAGYWGKVFVQEVGNGATVGSARDRAFNKLVKNQCDTFGKTEEEYHTLCEDNPEYVDKYIHCGMDSCVILGENQVIKR